MRGSPLTAHGFAWLLILSCAVPAAAEAPPASADDGIRAAVGRWYEEVRKKEEGRMWGVVAPGFIDASPPYRFLESKSRNAAPRIYTAMAAQAPKFAWEIDSIRRDSAFAKVQVWERGYYYASAVKRTYERAAATTFVLERSEKDGRWLILAHQSSSQGIPPNKITNPMPDLAPDRAQEDDGPVRR
ncbi:MAG TPA: hypothetical protein VF650_05705 [Allosphingosinicella sp.]|jgi:hypothetical protein